MKFQPLALLATVLLFAMPIEAQVETDSVAERLEAADDLARAHTPHLALLDDSEPTPCAPDDPVCQITCTTGMDSGFVLIPDIMLPEKIIIGVPVWMDEDGNYGLLGHLTICLR